MALNFKFPGKCQISHGSQRSQSQSAPFSQRDEFQISWIRHSDLHILTVGRYTYTAGAQITEVLKLEDLSVCKKKSVFSFVKLQTVVISPYTTPPRMNGYFRY